MTEPAPDPCSCPACRSRHGRNLRLAGDVLDLMTRSPTLAADDIRVITTLFALMTGETPPAPICRAAFGCEPAELVKKLRAPAPPSPHLH